MRDDAKAALTPEDTARVETFLAECQRMHKRIANGVQHDHSADDRRVDPTSPLVQNDFADPMPEPAPAPKINRYPKIDRYSHRGPFKAIAAVLGQASATTKRIRLECGHEYSVSRYVSTRARRPRCK